MNKEQAIREYRNHWIVYADKDLLLPISEIAKVVDLAESTVKTYLYKWQHLYAEATTIFDIYYHMGRDTVIYSQCDIHKNDGREKCYLFRFYDVNNNLVCSKVGTTKRSVNQRLNEELRSKTYANCVRAEIDRVYDCQNIPAEGLESFIRAEYIRKFPYSFKKNDRFFNILFDLDEIDRIVAEYFNKS